MPRAITCTKGRSLSCDLSLLRPLPPPLSLPSHVFSACNTVHIARGGNIFQLCEGKGAGEIADPAKRKRGQITPRQEPNACWKFEQLQLGRYTPHRATFPTRHKKGFKIGGKACEAIQWEEKPFPGLFYSAFCGSLRHMCGVISFSDSKIIVALLKIRKKVFFIQPANILLSEQQC